MTQLSRGEMRLLRFAKYFYSHLHTYLAFSYFFPLPFPLHKADYKAEMQTKSLIFLYCLNYY